jgi:hypothetical protein
LLLLFGWLAARDCRGDASITPVADASLSLCHVSDHADEIDGTIAFASRGVDAPAFATTTQEWRRSGDAGAGAHDRVRPSRSRHEAL